MYAGQGAKLQAGVQSNFSTIVAQTKALSFSREGLRYAPAYKQREGFVGLNGPGAMDIVGVKVEGDFSLIAYPDEIGLLISAVMGAEATPEAVSGSAVYDHVFTPMSALSASWLPKLTLTVDRIAAIFGYVGCKLDSMTLDIKKLDYLRAAFTVRGYDEITDTIDALTPSAKVPFNFTHGAATLGGTAYNIEGATLRFNNNLEDDLFTLLAAGTKMAEIEPQTRVLTGSITVIWDTTSNATRTAVFKAGVSTALVFTFTSTEAILTGKYYTLTITIPVAWITRADPVVDGPDRMHQTFDITMSMTSATPIWTITLRDGQSTKYIT